MLFISNWPALAGWTSTVPQEAQLNSFDQHMQVGADGEMSTAVIDVRICLVNRLVACSKVGIEGCQCSYMQLLSGTNHLIHMILCVATGIHKNTSWL